MQFPLLKAAYPIEVLYSAKSGTDSGIQLEMYLPFL